MMNFIQFLAAAAPERNPQAELIKSVGFFAVFGVIFYLLLIRPQQKRAKQQAEMLKTVRAGDKILTSGGIMGVVITVKDTSLTIRSADAKMEIAKSALGEIVKRGDDSSES